MKRYPFLSPVLALMLMLVGAPVASAQAEPAPPAGITVTGIGRATAPAETAIVVISVGSGTYMAGDIADMAPTPETPARDIAQPVVDALSASESGIGEIEVLRDPYSGEYGSYGEPLSAMIRFEVADPSTSDLQALIDPAVRAAVNAGLYVYMTSVVYSITDCTPLYQEARADAVADARESADLQAAALDVTLGDVVSARDTPAALYSGPWLGPTPLNSCTHGIGDVKMISTYGGPVFDPQQPAEVSVQMAVEITFEIDGHS